jgi:hypothetical protein
VSLQAEGAILAISAESHLIQSGASQVAGLLQKLVGRPGIQVCKSLHILGIRGLSGMS